MINNCFIDLDSLLLGIGESSLQIPYLCRHLVLVVDGQDDIGMDNLNGDGIGQAHLLQGKTRVMSKFIR